jgi:hypothetical protein
MFSSHLYEDSAAFSATEIQPTVLGFPNQEAAGYDVK